jgi:hypothetical protein
LDITVDSLSEISQLGIGQTPNAEQIAQAQRVANRMLQKWSAQRLLQYVIPVLPFALTGTKQDYTVGPSGADFTQARPMFVEAAVAVVPGTSGEKTMNILDRPKWGAISDKGAQCSPGWVPSDIFPEYLYPNMAFHVWPIPSGVLTIKLAIWQQLQQFLTFFDVLNLPPGYEEAIQHNLAMELSRFYDMPVSQDLQQLAADGLIEIQKLNAQSIGGAFGESRTLQNPNLDSPQQAPGSQPNPAQ